MRDATDGVRRRSSDENLLSNRSQRKAQANRCNQCIGIFPAAVIKEILHIRLQHNAVIGHLLIAAAAKSILSGAIA